MADQMKALHLHNCPLPEYAPHDSFVWTCSTCQRSYMAEAYNPGAAVQYFSWRPLGPPTRQDSIEVIDEQIRELTPDPEADAEPLAAPLPPSPQPPLPTEELLEAAPLCAPDKRCTDYPLCRCGKTIP